VIPVKDALSFVTCSGRSDGGGAQVHGVFSTMLYAHCTGVRYVHTPFQTISHNDAQDQYWTERWEAAFSLGHRELQINELDLTRIRLVSLTGPKSDLPPEPDRGSTLFTAKHCHWYADENPDRYSLIQTRLIEKYQLKSPRIARSSAEITVAVHVRRGDVNENQNARRYTPNQFIANQIGQISAALAGLPHRIHLFSEGSPHEFASLHQKVVLHLDGNVFADLHQMISSDVLVMAKSSLSYVAAILSPAVKIYTPFRHPPQTEWLVCNSDGLVPPRRLREALSRAMKGRIHTSIRGECPDA